MLNDQFVKLIYNFLMKQCDQNSQHIRTKKLFFSVLSTGEFPQSGKNNLLKHQQESTESYFGKFFMQVPVKCEVTCNVLISI